MQRNSTLYFRCCFDCCFYQVVLKLHPFILPMLLMLVIILCIRFVYMRIHIQKQQIITTPNGPSLKLALQKSSTPLNSSPQDDPNFPETLASIGTDIRNDLGITWHHIEQFCRQDEANYSEHIDDLKKPEYCNRAITECLLIMNWFVSETFASIFSERIVSKLRMYQFMVCCHGVMMKICVNSFVPVLQGKVLFAETVRGSVFGAIFQKSIAKVYGSYEAIPDNLISLLQLWTCYPVQQFGPHQHSQSDFIEFFRQTHSKNGLVLFWTRNSVRLQQSGMPSDTVYIIVRVLDIEGACLLQFLQLNGEKWKGKYSKSSKYWKDNTKIIQQHKINLKNIENYISIKDLLGIARQIYIFHNSQKHSINWYTSSTPKNKNTFILNIKQASISCHTMISVNFRDIKCQSLVYLVGESNCELISCSFKENGSRNFMAAFLEQGKNYLLYIFGESLQGKPLNYNITVYTSKSWCEIAQTTRPIFIQETSFLQFFTQIPGNETQIDPKNKNNKIITKCLYKQLGLGAMIINLEPNYHTTVHIRINRNILTEYGLELLNKNQNQKQIIYTPPCHSILLFRFRSRNKFKQNDPFPPLNSISISIGSHDQY